MKKSNSIFKQKGVPTWMGGLQIQLQSNLMYISLYNTSMITFTFWYTVGPTIKVFAPWASIQLFIIMAFLVYGLICFCDYKFMLPARVAFSARQSYRHKNPSVANQLKILSDIEAIKTDIKAIKERLGIEDVKAD